MRKFWILVRKEWAEVFKKQDSYFQRQFYAIDL